MTVQKFKCDICDQVVASESNLKEHIKLQHTIHVKDESFKCDVCDKDFKSLQNLNFHNKIHTGKMPQCSLCGKISKSMKALENHLKAHAMGRYVAPKVIKRQDGTVAMALPDDPNWNKKIEGSGVVIDTFL